MKTKQRKNNGYNYPASALLKEFPDDMWASTIGERLGVGQGGVQGRPVQGQSRVRR
jgi:hypothetical protein